MGQTLEICVNVCIRIKFYSSLCHCCCVMRVRAAVSIGDGVHFVALRWTRSLYQELHLVNGRQLNICRAIRRYGIGQKEAVSTTFFMHH